MTLTYREPVYDHHLCQDLSDSIWIVSHFLHIVENPIFPHIVPFSSWQAGYNDPPSCSNQSSVYIFTTSEAETNRKCTSESEWESHRNYSLSVFCV